MPATNPIKAALAAILEAAQVSTLGLAATPAQLRLAKARVDEARQTLQGLIKTGEQLIDAWARVEALGLQIEKNAKALKRLGVRP